jgi:hypothetical protein
MKIVSVNVGRPREVIWKAMETDILSRDAHRVAIIDIRRLYLGQTWYPALLERAMKVTALPRNWKAQLLLKARAGPCEVPTSAAPIPMLVLGSSSRRSCCVESGLHKRHR